MKYTIFTYFIEKKMIHALNYLNEKEHTDMDENTFQAWCV